jgi:hypothetical protein
MMQFTKFFLIFFHWFITFIYSVISNETSHEWTIKQPLENLKRLALNFKSDAFAHEWEESGGVVIPALKTVICSYPKAGTTTTKWILLALLGYEKSHICDDKHKRSVQFDHAQYLRRGMQYLRDRYPIDASHQGTKRQGWNNNRYLGPSRRPGSLNQSLEYNWMAANYFLDPDWTTIGNFIDSLWYIPYH